MASRARRPFSFAILADRRARSSAAAASAAAHNGDEAVSGSSPFASTSSWLYDKENDSTSSASCSSSPSSLSSSSAESASNGVKKRKVAKNAFSLMMGGTSKQKAATAAHVQKPRARPLTATAPTSSQARYAPSSSQARYAPTSSQARYAPTSSQARCAPTGAKRKRSSKDGVGSMGCSARKQAVLPPKEKTQSLLPSRPARPKRRKLSTKAKSSSSPKRVQLVLDVGQRNLGNTKCRECGMHYYPGQPDDEREHDKFHKSVSLGVPFAGWKHERLCDSKAGDSERVVVVDAACAEQHREKVGQILSIVNSALGMSPSDPPCADNEQIFLYVANKRVLGCVVAERRTEAFRLIVSHNAPTPSTRPSVTPSTPSSMPSAKPSTPSSRPSANPSAPSARPSSSSTEASSSLLLPDDASTPSHAASGDDSASSSSVTSCRNGISHSPAVSSGLSSFPQNQCGPGSPHANDARERDSEDVQGDSAASPSSGSAASPTSASSSTSSRDSAGLSVPQRKRTNKLSPSFSFLKQETMPKRKRPRKSDSDSDAAADAGPLLVCSKVASPCAVGVQKMWVHSTARGTGVAFRLVEQVRRQFAYGSLPERCAVAFSQPTRLGLAFAVRYTGREDVLVYR